MFRSLTTAAFKLPFGQPFESKTSCRSQLKVQEPHKPGWPPQGLDLDWGCAWLCLSLPQVPLPASGVAGLQCLCCWISHLPRQYLLSVNGPGSVPAALLGAQPPIVPQVSLYQLDPLMPWIYLVKDLCPAPSS